MICRLKLGVVVMDKQSSPTVHMTRRVAALRLRQLLDEVRLLTSSFPDLRDAFDPDELPIEFILKRDSQSEPYATLNPVPPSVTPMTRSMPPQGVEHRGSRKKPGSED
jgi:hypothetical protein